MTGPSPRVFGSIVVAAVGLFATAVLQRPEPAVVAAPFLVVSVIALVGVARPTVRVEASVTPNRVLQNELVTLVVTIRGGGSPARARVRIAIPAGLEPTEDGGTDVEVALGVDPVVISRDLLVRHWGAVPPIDVEVTTTDRLGVLGDRATTETRPVRALPREQTLRHILGPRSLRTIPGVHDSRQRGDGIEFVDTRPMVAGDRARDVNWRVSARHQELWVDDRRPERSGEVVLFLDTFVSVGDRYASTLRRTVEVAAALAAHHTAANDRIGLVDLGGVMRWVKPGGGTTQLYRVVEALVDTELYASMAEKSIDVLPGRALPRQALIVALSPLVDPQGIHAIASMRARGLDVAVIEVSPTDFVPQPTNRRRELAMRLWQADRASARRSLMARGVAVATWESDGPLDPVLAALGVFREAVLRAAR